MTSTIKLMAFLGMLGILCLSGCPSTTMAPTESATDATQTVTEPSTDITSSTTDDSPESAAAEIDSFIRGNHAEIKTDMAAGDGEHLRALAILMDIPAEQQPAFFTLARKNFHQLNAMNPTESRLLLGGLKTGLMASANIEN